jgi:hypothetical protein
VREGDLCSIDSGDGSYGVVKILKLEDGIAHLRVYANSYEQRPAEVDPASLTLGTIHDESFGLGHMPLAEETFLETWRPEVIGHAELEPDELDGYEIWREDEGGVWGGVEPPLRRSWLSRLLGR